MATVPKPMVSPLPLRQPLYPLEANAPPAKVCVTGATGYVAGAIVKRLLAAGHTVHATVRNTTSSKNSHLLAMEGATDRLKLFEGDCLKEGSFDEAIKGCKYVIHTASPVIMLPKRGKEKELLIDPALKGVDTCFTAVEKSLESVDTVVLTSSFYAMWSDNHINGPDHTFTEADWNTLSTERSLPYARSKVVAEERAWELYKNQKGEKKWRLVCINPGFITGPPEMASAPSETATFMRMSLRGDMGSATLPLGLPIVDVEDVAAAHVLAALNPQASGRILIAAESLTFLEMFEQARAASPDVVGQCKAPTKKMPKFVGKILGWVGMYPAELIKGEWDILPKFDNLKARTELGMSFLPIASRSVVDMAERFIELGEVKPKA